MDTIEMDPWKRFNFEDENERMKMPGFNWFNTGQFILNFKTPMEIVNRMNTLYEDLVSKNQLQNYSKNLIGKVKNEHSLYLEEDNEHYKKHNFIPNDIHEWIKDRIHQYLNFLQWEYRGIQTANAWINDYKAKEYNPIHIHLGRAGVYKPPLGKSGYPTGLIGMMCLKTPSHYGKEITNEENDQFHRAGFTEFIGSCPGKQFAGSSILLRMTVGEFVVFPYDMQHTVYPHFNENETRRTFPTNIDVYT